MALTRSFPFRGSHHVCGSRIQADPSGQGHAWKDVPTGDLLPSVEDVIAAEILDGQQPTGSATIGGTRYRWVVDDIEGRRTCIAGRWRAW